MASVHTFMQDYSRHLAQLEELRELLEKRLVTARAELGRAATAVSAGQRVAAVEAALDRMDRGVYGTCRRCGALIPFARLLQAPQEQCCGGCERTGTAA
ncbi:TraR/DksA C4-type zinc finger protein [Nonomuraea sp. NPDC049152]|uniref:TraR/DksA family transcriptional regulator n=1 Tax=Nonomuraea sp. NPDC049152 TaxID=3154350 RepID=UPI0033EA0CED